MVKFKCLFLIIWIQFFLGVLGKNENVVKCNQTQLLKAHDMEYIVASSNWFDREKDDFYKENESCHFDFDLEKGCTAKVNCHTFDIQCSEDHLSIFEGDYLKWRKCGRGFGGCGPEFRSSNDSSSRMLKIVFKSDQNATSVGQGFICRVGCYENEHIPIICGEDPKPEVSCGLSFEDKESKQRSRGMGGIIQAKIINGSPSVENANPWMVGLTFWQSQFDKIFCGGTLITNRHVLTAAHCVSPYLNKLWKIKVLIGVTSRNYDDQDETGHAKTRIQDILLHPNFDRDTFDNDIAILALGSHVDYGKNIQPACLPKKSVKIQGELAKTTGWGTLLSDLDLRPQTLQEAILEVMNNSYCRNVFESVKGGTTRLTENMFCAAGKDHEDTCQGDSGGPLIAFFEGKATLIGITSWGAGCGQGTPGVYTRISSQLEWIYQNIDMDCTYL